ncbi:hypothetical protein ACHWQZ_G002468 [Mnemiopsis leidyi]
MNECMNRGIESKKNIPIFSTKEVSCNTKSGAVDGKTAVNLLTSYLCTGDPLWTEKVADPALRALCKTFRSAICDHDLPDLKTLMGWIADIDLGLGEEEKSEFHGCMRGELAKVLEKLFCWGESSKVYMKTCLGFAKLWTCEHTEKMLCVIITHLHSRSDRLVENLSSFCPKPQNSNLSHLNHDRTIRKRHQDDDVDYTMTAVLARKKRQYDVTSMIAVVRTMVCRVDTIRQIVRYMESYVVTDLPGITELADLLSGPACCVLDSIID